MAAQSLQESLLIHIVSSRGVTIFESAKELARVLRLLEVKSSKHIKKAKDFVDQIHSMQLQQREFVS